MSKTQPFLRETDELRSLRVLEEIDKNPKVSQRELATSLGVALGVANACVHSLVRKGMVKIRGDNNRTITYHLTKKGLLHKTKLAVEWTRNTIGFYVQARHEIASQLGALAERGYARILLFGANDAADLAVMVAADAGVEIAGVADSDPRRIGAQVLGLAVAEPAAFAGQELDAIVVCLDVMTVDPDSIRGELTAFGSEIDIVTLGGAPL